MICDDDAVLYDPRTQTFLVRPALMKDTIAVVSEAACILERLRGDAIVVAIPREAAEDQGWAALTARLPDELVALAAGLEVKG